VLAARLFAIELFEQPFFACFYLMYSLWSAGKSDVFDGPGLAFGSYLL